MGRYDATKDRGRLQVYGEAAEAGKRDFQVDPRKYQLGSKDLYDAYWRAGAKDEMMAAGQLGDIAQEARFGRDRASLAAFQAGRDAVARGARSDALSAEGVNPAAAALMANRNALQGRLSTNQQYAVNAAQEQQARNALAMQALEAQAGIGAGMAQRGFQANVQQAMLNDQMVGRDFQAANMYLNPQAAAMAQDQANRTARNNALIGGAFGAAGTLGAALIP